MKPLLALDFDGVLCDSAPENAATSWRVCQRLWPRQFAGDGIPAAQIERFCAIRPYMETGYQSILMTKLMWDGAPEAEYTTDFAALLPRLLARYALTKEQLVAEFGAERDRWLAQDEAGWLSYNRFYPGVPEVVRELLARSRALIVTTKETRFVLRLFAQAGIAFPEADVFGLERKRKKEAILQDFADGGEHAFVAFVEDRLATLQRVIAVPALARVRLGFAQWGYTTPAQRDEAARTPGIRLLDAPADLPEMLA
jgi:phosphoglycolate phosphatase-like HAD superfamily hydrolase